MEEKKIITPGQKRVKNGDFIFYIVEKESNSIMIECENRKTYQKFSSGEVVLNRLKPETFTVALEESQHNIKCEIIHADAKLIIQVSVNHEFLSLIQESVELILICDKESDPTLQVLKNMNLEIEEIREEMKDLCLAVGNNIVQEHQVSLQGSQQTKVADLTLLSTGNYIINLNYHSKGTSSEPQITLTAIFKDGDKEEKVYDQVIYSQFTYTGYTTFQNVKFIIPKVKNSQKNLQLSLSSSAPTNLTNINVTLCKAY